MLAVNGGVCSCWGKPWRDGYMFDVLCGPSDVEVDVLGDMPAPVSKKASAANRDLVRKLREGIFPPSLPASPESDAESEPEAPTMDVEAAPGVAAPAVDATPAVDACLLYTSPSPRD